MATKKPAGIQGIEPHKLSLPAMDRPSLAFGWFLDRMQVAHDESDPNHNDLVLNCEYCGEDICVIEHGDNLRVLLNTALAHTCGG